MATWKPRTKRDDNYELLAALLPDVPDGHPSPEADVRCVCGRVEWPGMMIDVTSLDTTTKSHTMRHAGEPPTHLCSGCIETLHRKSVISRIALAEAQGAPVEWLGQQAAKRKYLPRATGEETALSPAVAAEAARIDLDVAHEVALSLDVLVQADLDLIAATEAANAEVPDVPV